MAPHLPSFPTQELEQPPRSHHWLQASSTSFFNIIILAIFPAIILDYELHRQLYFFCSNRFFSEFTEAFVNLRRDDICSENLSIQQILFSCHCSALLLYKKKSKLIFRNFFYIKIRFEKCQSISKLGKE